LNFEESFNITTQLLHGISVDRIFPGQQWAYAGTPPSHNLA